MSERRLRRATAVLAALGAVIAAYLTYVHYAGLKPLCLASGGCERVQSSPYAELLGLPVAAIGLAGYLAILGALLLPGEPARVVGALLALVGFGFSAYLTYLEVFRIHALCQWCVASAALMAALAAIAVVRLLRGGEDPAPNGPPRAGTDEPEERESKGLGPARRQSGKRAARWATIASTGQNDPDARPAAQDERTA